MNSPSPTFLVDVHAGNPVSVPACPRCGGLTQRTQRRLFDRLLSRITPLRRYSCRDCNWQGNVRVSDQPDASGISPRRSQG